MTPVEAIWDAEARYWRQTIPLEKYWFDRAIGRCCRQRPDFPSVEERLFGLWIPRPRILATLPTP